MTRLKHEAQAVSSDHSLSSHAPCIPSVSPEILKLVCDRCWRTVFSADSFHTAWVAQFVSTSPESAGFSYTTPTWEEMQRSMLHIQSPYSDNFQGDQAARFIPHREVRLHVDTTLGYDLIKKCVDECLRHERCPQPLRALMPTRVIDCANPEQPRIFVNHGIKENYVALSYVWGEKQPHCTTTKNLDFYIAGIPLQNIPKSNMDTIKVTQKLGLRYLWVDALCILQDSKDDKAQEIAQICRIFRNAYVTIIAACADKVSNGFLQTQDIPDTIRNLPFRCPDGGIGTMRLLGNRHAPDEPVNKRAWCLEERVLSPRRVIYASHTVQYECQTTHVNANDVRFIDSLDGIPCLPDRVLLPTPDIPSSDLPADEEAAKAWCDILGLYTRRTFTKPRDRLVALSGIVEQFHSFWPHTTYIAGLWEHQLPSCLLWYQGDNNQRSRPNRYRAPSWSWASTDREVTMIPGSNDDIFLCTVIQCDAILARQINPYGEVTAGSLVLNIILQPAVWDPVEGSLYDAAGLPGDDPQEWPDLFSERGEIGIVVRDAIEPVSERIGKIYVAIVRDTGQTLLGLVLTPAPSQISTAKQNDPRSFHRVGWFTAPFCDKLVWLSSRYQHIKII
ncbi:heterokaryon incompatibility protein-domain-containing protein [Armillaria novae-zelandiae]|uniref:Heterokaryon incompatibility protein-domain-containing protein n=1 Tax=Armillaria novae-zelandiae TaxID=153914 RepID=A0AA39PDS1_9AGAR|nr:heterokaryon incompatibility protein-domain-containing protein [Armillaria novae-zelandiae]